VLTPPSLSRNFFEALEACGREVGDPHPSNDTGIGRHRAADEACGQTKPQTGLRYKSFRRQVASWATARRMVAEIESNWGALCSGGLYRHAHGDGAESGGVRGGYEYAFQSRQRIRGQSKRFWISWAEGI